MVPPFNDVAPADVNVFASAMVSAPVAAISISPDVTVLRLPSTVIAAPPAILRLPPVAVQWPPMVNVTAPVTASVAFLDTTSFAAIVRVPVDVMVFVVVCDRVMVPLAALPSISMFLLVPVVVRSFFNSTLASVLLLSLIHI